MITNILLTKTGALVNGIQAKLPLLDSISGILFANQISLSFYNAIKLQNDIYIPDEISVVKTGLSGTVTISAKPTADCPYPVALSSPDIDISNSCMIQFTGIAEEIFFACSNIVGANYIYATIAKK